MWPHATSRRKEERVEKNNVKIPKPKEERVGASEVKERDASSRGL